MISIGIDLAGLEKNKTGFCILEDNVANSATWNFLVKPQPKNLRLLSLAETFILHTDDEIVENVKKVKPDVVGIDAPLIYPPKIRKCDRTLKKYGAMPPTMKSMSILSKRGFFLAKKLKGFNVIEVFPTASAKILGVYNKDINMMVQGLLNLDLIINNSISTKDEVDALLAALTGLLHLHNLTEDVGDKEGVVICPKANLLF